MKSIVFGVVFKINFISRSASYIGETKRRVSVRINIRLSTGHAMNFINVYILSKDIYDCILKTKEALFTNDLILY